MIVQTNLNVKFGGIVYVRCSLIWTFCSIFNTQMN